MMMFRMISLSGASTTRPDSSSRLLEIGSTAGHQLGAVLAGEGGQRPEGRCIVDICVPVKPL